MSERKFGEITQDDRKKSVAGRVATFLGRNRYLHPFAHAAAQRQHEVEQKEKRKQQEYEKRSESETRPYRQKLVEKLNASDFDFSRSFTASFRPSRRIEIPSDDPPKRKSHLAYIDVVFSAGQGSLRVLQGTTRGLGELDGFGFYSAPSARQEEESFKLTLESAEETTVTEAVNESEFGAFGAPFRYMSAMETLGQLEPYMQSDHNWHSALTITYFDDAEPTPLEPPKRPKYVE